MTAFKAAVGLMVRKRASCRWTARPHMKEREGNRTPVPCFLAASARYGIPPGVFDATLWLREDSNPHPCPCMLCPVELRNRPAMTRAASPATRARSTIRRRSRSPRTSKPNCSKTNRSPPTSPGLKRTASPWNAPDASATGNWRMQAWIRPHSASCSNAHSHKT